MALMDEIGGFQVPARSVAIWWLGQSGFIFKSPGGTLAGVDLYLTDSCAGLAPGLDLSRRVPVLIAPGELRIDLFACTHNHQDHTDPETIRWVNKDSMHFLGPHPSCDVFRREGVREDRILPAWPDRTIEFRDLQIRGTFALPTDDTDLNHMGYVFEFAGGVKVWVTGDTAPCELLHAVGKQKPDIAITVINGGFSNLSHWEAAGVMAQVKPKVAIPSHHDMFPDNAVDPRQFEVSLKMRAPEVRFHAMEYGKPFVYPGPVK
jgi:L-ascorbate 6-phosphate lactonase